MPRYRRVRRYRKKSGRWASNIREFVESNIQVPAVQGLFYGTTQLVINPAQNSNATSQVYTVKNIEASFELETNVMQAFTDLESLCYYIMYVPQGMTVGDDYNLQHPEYVMAYRFYGSPVSEVNDQVVTKLPLKIRTRLSRKLQTGDSIILYIKGLNQVANTKALHVNGVVRWWTKAN